MLWKRGRVGDEPALGGLANSIRIGRYQLLTLPPILAKSG
jgi:hypothetical protein